MIKRISKVFSNAFYLSYMVCRLLHWSGIYRVHNFRELDSNNKFLGKQNKYSVLFLRIIILFVRFISSLLGEIFHIFLGSLAVDHQFQVFITNQRIGILRFINLN